MHERIILKDDQNHFPQCETYVCPTFDVSITSDAVATGTAADVCVADVIIDALELEIMSPKSESLSLTFTGMTAAQLVKTDRTRT